MYNQGMVNRISQGQSANEGRGAILETEYLGNVDSPQYRKEAYMKLHGNEIKKANSPEEEYEQELEINKLAQEEFDDTLKIADRNNYINFKNSMALVERCQVGNPEKPNRFFSRALYNYIRSRWDEKYTLKFFTAVGGTHLDIVHKIDFYFKLYLKETNEEIVFATADITGRDSKDKATADVLINIRQDERDKYDPSPVNKSFDKEFFDSKIAEFGEEIIEAMVRNYNKTN